MQRRRFMQLTGASALAAIAPRAALAAPTNGLLSEDDQLALDIAISEIESLGAGMLEAAVPAGVQTVQELDEAGNTVFRSVLTPDAVVPSFPNPPITAELLETLKGRKYWQLAEAEREVPVWPELRFAPDYLHLADFVPPSAEFILTAPLLDRLAERNAFALRKNDKVIVFGLRGCQLPDGVGATGWQKEQALRVAPLTHMKLDCTIGLWRPADGMLSLFRAATVPAVDYMFKSLVQRGGGTSLLPTGLYDYRRGTHLFGKPGVQRGALRIQGEYPVLRTAATLSYNPFLATTAWTRGAAHNIHAAGPYDAYWSAGCQVVQGDYVKPARVQTTGAWNDFRLMAGTADAAGAIPADGQIDFQYMLLTGHEAALAYHAPAGFEDSYRPLRFGSAGARVAALQARLLEDHGNVVAGLTETGRFDMPTSFAALIDSKLSQGDFATPIAAS